MPPLLLLLDLACHLVPLDTPDPLLPHTWPCVSLGRARHNCHLPTPGVVRLDWEFGSRPSPAPSGQPDPQPGSSSLSAHACPSPFATYGPLIPPPPPAAANILPPPWIPGSWGTGPTSLLLDSTGRQEDVLRHTGYNENTESSHIVHHRLFPGSSLLESPDG